MLGSSGRLQKILFRGPVGVAVFVGSLCCWFLAFCLVVVFGFLAPASESWLRGFYCKPSRTVMVFVGLVIALHRKVLR